MKLNIPLVGKLLVGSSRTDVSLDVGNPVV